MESRLAAIIEQLEGKMTQKKKRYVDPEEYERIKGAPPEEEEDDEEEIQEDHGAHTMDDAPPPKMKMGKRLFGNTKKMAMIVKIAKMKRRK